MSRASSSLKLGMITVEPHGRPWAEVLSRMSGVNMEYAWDYDLARAKKYAEKYHIPHVAEDVEEMLGGVDAVEMVRLARSNGALLMSCSAMRYASEIRAMKEVVEDGGLGKISGAMCMIGTGVATLKWYIIHILEALYVPFGPGIESVFALPSHAPVVVGKKQVPGAYGLVFRWNDGRIASMLMVEDQTDAAEGEEYEDRSPRILWPTATVVPPYLPFHYNIRIFGDMDWAEVRTVGKGCYTYKLRAFLDMIQTGEEAIPLEHTLELTQAIVLAEKSLESGKPEQLRPIEEIMPRS